MIQTQKPSHDLTGTECPSLRSSGAILIKARRKSSPLKARCRVNGNFRFQLHLCAKTCTRRPLESSSNRPGHSWVAIAPRLAVLLSGFDDFPPPTSLPANTSPHWMASERSILCLSSFTTRPAAAAPRSFAACSRIASDSGAPRPAKASNTARASPAARRSSPGAAASW